jgi:hypothetical protein
MILSPELECRAWYMFVEIAMKVVGVGLADSKESEPWVNGLENEV